MELKTDSWYSSSKVYICFIFLDDNYFSKLTFRVMSIGSTANLNNIIVIFNFQLIFLDTLNMVIFLSYSPGFQNTIHVQPAVAASACWKAVRHGRASNTHSIRGNITSTWKIERLYRTYSDIKRSFGLVCYFLRIFSCFILYFYVFSTWTTLFLSRKTLVYVK